MEIETIYGQVIAKANNYQAVPGKDGQKRIIKNDRIREYEILLPTMQEVSRETHFRSFQAIYSCLAWEYSLRPG